ncbi:TraR/DksA C4-type zinc finger protein [Pseudomonas sp. GM67]|uniref:TraR/DksA C4-type zinc finger protein n=1 Tax=Pseudomonas sp. GM67 TaxID=1144335 RepID=UPI000270C368|nr:TraR/DksA C4-type zinc finger protein [Pseudomonas sp. GM67]EJM92438.1 DnaK suppressor protein [Pseudomonas sp. GM67]
MADVADDADIVIDQIRDHALAQIPRYTGISATECEECDEDIPEGRRNAVKGVKLCVGCAEREALVKQGVRRL